MLSLQRLRPRPVPVHGDDEPRAAPLGSGAAARAAARSARASTTGDAAARARRPWWAGLLEAGEALIGWLRRTRVCGGVAGGRDGAAFDGGSGGAGGRGGAACVLEADDDEDAEDESAAGGGGGAVIAGGKCGSLAWREWAAADDSSLGKAVHVAIMLNMLCLALDSYGASGARTHVLETLNVCFTVAFALELVVKLAFVGPCNHFCARDEDSVFGGDDKAKSTANAMNIFDAFIVGGAVRFISRECERSLVVAVALTAVGGCS